MNTNPAWVNAKYEGWFIGCDTGAYMEPYIRIATTKGYKKILNPVWMQEMIPTEMRATKQLSMAWIRLTLDDGITELDMPNWWPKENNTYFHEGKPKR
jgi:hypothetical protein